MLDMKNRDSFKFIPFSGKEKVKSNNGKYFEAVTTFYPVVDSKEVEGCVFDSDYLTVREEFLKFNFN